MVSELHEREKGELSDAVRCADHLSLLAVCHRTSVALSVLRDVDSRVPFYRHANNMIKKLESAGLGFLCEGHQDTTEAGLICLE